MNTVQHAAIAEDLRKIGTTAIAAAMVGIFLSDHRLLTGCAFVLGVLTWAIGVYLTREE
ncbi:hypothetical protein ACCD10_20370 [Pseudomonas sp. Pseusp122]|uniref:hypothetical protein n=1 Tax=unclassified Pseudomonas TaxID=196821 RepID=UPI0039A62252